MSQKQVDKLKEEYFFLADAIETITKFAEEAVDRLENYDEIENQYTNWRDANNVRKKDHVQALKEMNQDSAYLIWEFIALKTDLEEKIQKFLTKVPRTEYFLKRLNEGRFKL